MELSGKYLTYMEYKGLGGTLSEMPFNLLEYKSRKIIDKYTSGRLVDLETQVNEVKLCVYELIIELNGDFTEGKNNDVASENTDGYSITYQNISKEQISGKNKEIEDIINSYLGNCKLEDGTPYLYRGV